jgi:hypothetical protein
LAGDGIDREQLLRSGWRQGSVLDPSAGLTAAAWVVEKRQGTTKLAKAAKQRGHQGDAFPFLWERPPRDVDRLVLLTQQCDVIKPPEEFPLVEFALAFETKSAGVLAEANLLTSARYFLLTQRGAEPPGVVLDVRFRCQADKGLLLELEPDNTLADALDRQGERHLAEWLGRRYEREAVADTDTEQVVEPVRRGWRSLSEERPEVAAQWASQLAEVRYLRDENDRLTIYGVAYEAGAEGEILELLGWVLEQLPGHHDAELVVTDLWKLSVAERLLTQEIDLEWASYEEPSSPSDAG